MKEQLIDERASIIANLRQLVESLVELNARTKAHVSSNKTDIPEQPAFSAGSTPVCGTMT